MSQSVTSWSKSSPGQLRFASFDLDRGIEVTLSKCQFH